MSLRTFSATEVKNRFGRVLRELAITGGPVVVEKDNKPVAVILSFEEYNRAFARQPFTVAQEQAAQSSFGMWIDRPEVDDAWLADGRARWQSDWQDA